MIFYKSALNRVLFLDCFQLNQKPYTEDNQKKIGYLESTVCLLVEVVVRWWVHSIIRVYYLSLVYESRRG